MDRALFLVVLGAVKLLQALPLRWVARLGRVCGGIAYYLDARHQRVALRNLSRCFAEKSAAEVHSLAREHFRRLGENYCSAIKTASMDWEDLRRHAQYFGTENLPLIHCDGRARSRIVAVGHFGNFELFAHYGRLVEGYQGATTYRALKQPLLNGILQSLRARSGCQFFERRTDARALMQALSERPLLLGLLADQHAGERGVAIPFFGQECSTTPAPAILALRYGCPLHAGFCFRTGLAQWRLEIGVEIPTCEDDQPRPLQAIMSDVNRAFEEAVRRDPANWFWVHNRWKPFRSRTGHPAQVSPNSIESNPISPL